MQGMTDRDHFAAAALTGLLASDQYDRLVVAADYADTAYELADAMLRCRSGGDCPLPDNARNLDAAPAARATEPEPEPAARRRPAGGTGDTQSFDAYASFAGTVMDWISEATSAYAASCSSDGGRKIMADACSRCWDAFDRIAYPTDHGASPEARASVESVAPQPTAHADRNRTDKAAIRPGEGTGDTPKPINDCVSDRPKPINGPDPDSRVWETPVHTPAPHATPGEGSMPRDGTQEPAAWAALRDNGTVYACHEDREMVVAVAGDRRIVPLWMRVRNSFLSPEPMAYCYETPLHGWEIASRAAAAAEPELRWRAMVTLNDAEMEAVEYYIGTGGPRDVDDALRRLVERHGAKK